MSALAIARAAHRADRINRKVRRMEKSGCWIWMGSRIKGGYGKIQDGKGITALTHRFSYEVFVGPIPEGMQLDHLCCNRACVNPEHLEPVTARENQLRSNSVSGINARKTHCNRGHVFTEENTYITSDNRRQCRMCSALRERRRRAAA